MNNRDRNYKCLRRVGTDEKTVTRDSLKNENNSKRKMNIIPLIGGGRRPPDTSKNF